MPSKWKVPALSKAVVITNVNGGCQAHSQTIAAVQADLLTFTNV